MSTSAIFEVSEAETVELTIKVSGLCVRDAVALETFLATAQHLGEIGHDRWLSLYVNGSKAFRPVVQITTDEATRSAMRSTGVPAVKLSAARRREWRIDPDIVLPR